MSKIFYKAYSLEQRFFGGWAIWRSPLARKVKRFFFTRMQPEFVEVRGMKFYLDMEDGIRPKLSYQKSVVDIFDQNISRGDTVLDLGANIGYFTCMAARLVGDGGRVFAFEPEPKSAALLAKNLETNGFKNVTAVQKAVLDRPMAAELWTRGPHSSTNFSRFDGKDRPLSVDAVVIDDFFRDYKGKISLVKMDIIGSEAKAFRGARNVVKKNRGVALVVSFTPRDLKMAGSDPEEFLCDIADAGFRVYEADNHMRRVERSEFKEFVRRYSPEKGLARANLFCARQRMEQ